MPVIRLILLLVVLGGLTLLLLQNWSPVLPLVFLGVQTQALPLAVWILFSIAAGAITSLFITSLFRLAHLFARSPSKPRRQAEPPPRSSAQRSETRYTAASRPSPKPDTASTSSNAADDWGSDSTTNDDWDFEENTQKTQNSNSHDDVRDSKTYEVSNEPKSGYQAGSVYSYSYREPSNSGVGKTESVYDADYRVITPPYREPDTTQEDDDWGFEDDDDFEDQGDRDSGFKRR
jgi:uncharacterized integral membrane protein